MLKASPFSEWLRLTILTCISQIGNVDPGPALGLQFVVQDYLVLSSILKKMSDSIAQQDRTGSRNSSKYKSGSANELHFKKEQYQKRDPSATYPSMLLYISLEGNQAFEDGEITWKSVLISHFIGMGVDW